MGKVNLWIKSCLRNKKLEYNIKGIIQEGKIKFKEMDALMIIDLKEKILERKKERMNFLFDFQKQLCIIKDETMEYYLELKVLECNISKDTFFVKYQIEKDNYELEIKFLEEI